MRHYGYLLESFRTNPEQLNDALFTMMHHVAGDLKRPEALYVPHILKAFSDMWEEEGGVKMCDDWTDLIAYVIRRFIATMGDRPHACAANLLDCLNSADTIDENGFSKSQLENLYWYYSQCEHAEDPVGGIIEMYKATHSITKTRLSVIQALLSQGIITHAQYMGLMYMKSVLTSKTSHEGSVVAEAGSEHEHYDSDGHDTDNEHSEVNSRAGLVRDQVEVLKDLLKKQGKGYLIDWLKQILLDTCHVKLKGANIQTSDGVTLEPIPFHFNCIKK